MLWDIISSSVAGTKHTRAGKGCDDANGFWSNDKISVFAVADGAGSASHGALGSDLAIKTLVNIIKQKSLNSKLPDDKKGLESLAVYLVNAVRYELEKKALGFSSPDNFEKVLSGDSVDNKPDVVLGRQGRKRKQLKNKKTTNTRSIFDFLLNLIGIHPKKTDNPELLDQDLEYGHPSVENIIKDTPKPATASLKNEKEQDKQKLKDYSTTILAVITTSRWLLALQIGDGVIVVQQGNKLVPLTTPTKGGYFNVTSFVTSNSYLEDLQHFVIPNINIDRIFLMTDGLESLAINLKTNIAQPSFFKNFIDYFDNQENLVEDEVATDKNLLLAKILDSSPINKKTDDDKTLLMATRLQVV